MIRIKSLPRGCSVEAPIIPPLTNRRIGGRKAKRAGDALERAIMAGAAMGERVRLTKLPPCGGRYVAAGRFVGDEMPCDIIGSVVASGRAIYIDAKTSENASGFDLSNAKLLKRHQIAFLYNQAKAGAIAGLMVECKALSAYLWLGGEHLEGPLAKLPWCSERWVNLGPTTELVNFGKLITFYNGDGK